MSDEGTLIERLRARGDDLSLEASNEIEALSVLIKRWEAMMCPTALVEVRWIDHGGGGGGTGGGGNGDGGGVGGRFPPLERED